MRKHMRYTEEELDIYCKQLIFESWAKSKGMLIDKDETGIYKSIETRAHFDTWKAAQKRNNP